MEDRKDSSGIFHAIERTGTSTPKATGADFLSLAGMRWRFLSEWFRWGWLGGALVRT